MRTLHVILRSGRNILNCNYHCNITPSADAEQTVCNDVEMTWKRRAKERIFAFSSCTSRVIPERLRVPRFHMDSEEVLCPYDDAHRVPPMDYFLHVARCRKAHYALHGSKIRLCKCPYNGRHFIPELEKHMHEAMCPDRKQHEKVVKLMKSDPIRLEVAKERSGNDGMNDEEGGNRYDEEYDDVSVFSQTMDHLPPELIDQIAQLTNRRSRLAVSELRNGPWHRAFIDYTRNRNKIGVGIDLVIDSTSQAMFCTLAKYDGQNSKDDIDIDTMEVYKFICQHSGSQLDLDDISDKLRFPHSGFIKITFHKNLKDWMVCTKKQVDMEFVRKVLSVMANCLVLHIHLWYVEEMTGPFVESLLDLTPVVPEYVLYFHCVPSWNGGSEIVRLLQRLRILDESKDYRQTFNMAMIKELIQESRLKKQWPLLRFVCGVKVTSGGKLKT